MSIFKLITLLGGLGLFIYGMQVMAEGLEKAAGERMQKIIGVMTSNVFKGVLVGTTVTALVQSSSATTVMVVGFVNAGIMKLTQAVGVIMGANIGTTVTAQILRLGDIDKGVWYLTLLRPSTLAPLAVAIGVALIVFAKRKKIKTLGEILAGFGILFIGMNTMEGAVHSLRDLPQFKQAFIAFRNPVWGVLIGAGVTALLQSSSASVGILQAVASAGLVTFSSAVPIIMGQNIGTCITALLSSVGANKNAKKAAFIHLIFNVTGTILFLAIIYIYQGSIGFSFWDSPLNRGGIADFHTIFNVSNTIILLPFAGLLVRLAHFAIRGKEDTKGYQFLDERFLTTPSVAVPQVVKEVIRMAKTAQENVIISMNGILNNSVTDKAQIEENENTIDEMESYITQYLVKLSEESLSNEENKLVSGLFHVITDIERIGDHAVNISEQGEYIIQEEIEFSKRAKHELEVMFTAVNEIVQLAIDSYENQDIKVAHRIQPYEDVIDLFKEKLRVRHIERLSQGKCHLKAGVVFLDIVNNLERIADHCSNIGISIEQLHSPENDFDPHKYLRSMHQNKTEEYKTQYKEFSNKYDID